MRESELLQHVFSASRGLGDQVLIPPGDDMAMVSLEGGPVLAAIDQLVAGCHFDPLRTPFSLVGRKAVTRSLSDIAAMAARPVATLVGVALPLDFGQDAATELFDAMRETATHYSCPLIGGDIAVHRSDSALVCSVAVLAEPGPIPPVRRSGARVGDVVYVTGELGGSLEPDGLGRHLTFEPRLEEAIELAALLRERLHAMIDISDGLGRDAAHLAECSGVQIRIDAERIPCRGDVSWRGALSDAEDYELCFAASGEVPDRVGAVAVAAVGRVAKRPDPEAPLVLVRDGAATFDVSQLGWEHRS